MAPITQEAVAILRAEKRNGSEGGRRSLKKTCRRVAERARSSARAEGSTASRPRTLLDGGGRRWGGTLKRGGESPRGGGSGGIPAAGGAYRRAISPAVPRPPAPGAAPRCGGRTRRSPSPRGRVGERARSGARASPARA